MSEGVRVGEEGKDPLLVGANPAKDLFLVLARFAYGRPNDVVMLAAQNLLVNILRQQCDNMTVAADEVDRLAARLKDMLAGHYDGHGRRRGVFPFDQTVEVPPLNEILPGFKEGE